jgi:RNA polymerase sigma-70 factor (ECF subfamily)
MTTEETQALARVRAGDPDGFEVIVRLHARTLQRLAVRIVGDPAAAEDVVQDAFLRAYRAIDGFRDGSELLPWLRRIASNVAIDHLRRSRPEAPLEVRDGQGGWVAREPAAESPLPDRNAASAQVRAAAQRAMHRLSADERAAFVLRHLEGRSIAEIGRTLGKGDNATKQSIFRAVKKLRQALAGFSEMAEVRREELA